MEVIKVLVDNFGLLSILIILTIGLMSTILIVGVLVLKTLSIIIYKKRKRELEKVTHLVFLSISKDENLTRFDIYKRIYTNLKPQLILMGLDEDRASREANKYCVKYTDIIFTEHQIANSKKRDDWQFMGEISLLI